MKASTSAEQLEILSSALFAEDKPSRENMTEEKTLREHATPPVNQAPSCITTPTLHGPLELKSGLIDLLPKFRGLMNEEPYRQLKEFHVVCSSMKPESVTEEQIKLRAFPFSLDNAAKDWLSYLTAGSITTWEEMMRLFLDRYFTCCLLPTERSKIDSVSCGSMEDKTPIEARKLTDTMVATSRKFRERQELPEQCHYFEKWKKLEELPKKVSRGHNSGVEVEPKAEVVVQKQAKRVIEFEKTILYDAKLLDTNMKYLILDNKLGSKVPLMPKNIGVIVMWYSELGHNIVPKPPD
ncbi:hypothetical protein G2W53_016211 [Senna tora]|uniref:Retrotransposon gag domain-containing protein n=1 Tax=Senna tora TaxID=362788 RepID=A0A834TNZ5_9FABA|nr:hypothetical protein G2W53_016211 [Senna tora]